ncbi:MAG: SEC-C domain-containing protein [Sulfurimonas sp.]|nr:SEC-C domain-containing protein [Sulfurimonas sp.]
MNCYCGHNINYDECCGAILDAKKTASTPHELTRSRYCAFVKSNIEYLNSTSLNNEKIKKLSYIKWLKLDVIDSYENIVEFKAYYRDSGNIHVLHEKSSFVKQNGKWFYIDGEIYNSKINRNENCPCGSKKKFKKCCV